MWKQCCRAGQATDDNMAHAHCMLDIYGYRYTLRICNTYCFSTATIVRRRCLSVTLYVYSLSCVVIFIFLTHYVFHKLIAGLYYLFQRSKCPHGSPGGRIWHRAAGLVLISKNLVNLRLKGKHFYEKSFRCSIQHLRQLT